MEPIDGGDGAVAVGDGAVSDMLLGWSQSQRHFGMSKSTDE